MLFRSFVNENGIKVIDPEFGFYGPMAYDIGNVWGNLFFPLAHHLVVKGDENYVSSLKNLITETIDKTIKMLEISFDENVKNKFLMNQEFKEYYLKEIISDSFGYSGTEIIRRVVGDSKVIEVSSVEDSKQRKNLDKLLIDMGIKLILNRELLNQGQDVIEVFESLA